MIPKDLERQLRELNNLIPQIAAAIVGIITAIGVIVAAIQSGDGDGSSKRTTPSNPSTQTTISKPANTGANSKPANSGDYSKPEFADAKYLHTHRTGVWDMQSGVDVTVDGKDYPQSLISTDNRDSSGVFNIDERFSALNYTAAWATNIPNSGGVGIVEVRLNGGLRDRVLVKQGEMKPRTVDVRGGGELRITMTAVDPVDDKKSVAPNGLAALTPTLK